MRVFIDTSAYAKRFVEEVGSEEVDDLFSEATELGVSIILLPEIISGMNRRLREKNISKRHYDRIKNVLSKEVEDIDVVQITYSVLNTTIQLLEKNKLRAMDSIHIACAVEWDADCFATSDKKQFAAAKKVIKNCVFI